MNEKNDFASLMAGDIPGLNSALLRGNDVDSIIHAVNEKLTATLVGWSLVDADGIPGVELPVAKGAEEAIYATTWTHKHRNVQTIFELRLGIKGGTGLAGTIGVLTRASLDEGETQFMRSSANFQYSTELMIPVEEFVSNILVMACATTYGLMLEKLGLSKEAGVAIGLSGYRGHHGVNRQAIIVPVVSDEADIEPSDCRDALDEVIEDSLGEERDTVTMHFGKAIQVRD